MALRMVQRSRILSAFGAVALMGVGCVQLRDEDSSAENAARTGTVALPLRAMGPSGATYYLVDATFVIRDAENNPVAALSSEEAPEAQVLSIELPVGTYSVELVDGWRLTRAVDDRRVVVPATVWRALVSNVVVRADEEARVSFDFRTTNEVVPFDRAPLRIGISVYEVPFCGNGLLEQGEVCDDGALAGRPNGCDGSCAFQCEGACPLRVDPNAAEGGDGATWSSPLRSVQAAIDIQGALGGGDVWITGPGPYSAPADGVVETFIQLREGVRLFGGFAGTETWLDERDLTNRTVITGWNIPNYGAESVPLIVGASNTVLDGFTITGHAGVVLHVEGAENFEATRLYLRDNQHQFHSQMRVLDSTATFDELRVEDGRGNEGASGVQFDRSEAIIKNSDFARLFAISGTTGVHAEQSRVVLDRVTFTQMGNGSGGAASGLGAWNSDVLAMHTFWRGGDADAALIYTIDSRFVAVNSHWEGVFGGAGAIIRIGRGSWGAFLNCSFVDNGFYTGGMIHATGELEVNNSTFWNNVSAINWSPLDINADPGAAVSLYNSIINAEPDAVAEHTGAGNCPVDASAPLHIQNDAGYTQVLLTAEIGCTNIGDDAAVGDATQRAAQFAASLGSELPLQPEWWQTQTSVYPLCDDIGPVDPGRHHQPAFCAGSEPQ